MNTEETIVAIATPTGRGAIGVVRLDGCRSLEIVRRLFHAKGERKIQPWRSSFGQILDQEGRLVDEVIVTYFQRPRSYTGDEMVEISAHGSPIVLQRIQALCLEQGARQAEPGEFTKRAFLNGKLDITKAEAVNDLVAARTAFQAQIAAKNLSGELRCVVESLADRLLKVCSRFEAAIDFVEEEENFYDREAMAGEIAAVRQELATLVATSRAGRRLRQGAEISIVGAPNVGKSTLFNAILKENRAIVTAAPGTTRDIISESIDFQGMPVTLYDTAGMRAVSEEVERIGVSRSLELLERAPLALLVFDTSRPLTREDHEIAKRVKQAKRTYIAVLNKIDLERVTAAQAIHELLGRNGEVVEVIASEPSTIAPLERRLGELLLGDVKVSQAIITRARQAELIENTIDYLEQGLSAIKKGLLEEYLVEDLNRARRELGRITGQTTTEDLLDEIFADFCIGK